MGRSGRIFCWNLSARASSSPHVYFLPRFQRLTFDEKSTFISVAEAMLWSMDKDQTDILIYDAMTNKIIGRFDNRRGLSLD